MTAVVLAGSSALLFGAMTVALRMALQEGVAPEAGTLFTVGTALVVILVYTGARAEWGLGAAWPFMLTGLLAPGCSQILFTFAIRDAGASRASMTVGTAPLIAVAIASEEAASGRALGLDRPDRRSERRCG